MDDFIDLSGTNIKLDEWQQQIFNEFLLFKQEIFSNKRVLGFLKKDKYPKNVYLHGSVGRGKSMIMKDFYDHVNVKKKYIHYAEFMLEIHKKLKIVRLQNKPDPLLIVIKGIAKEIELICIDEFEVKDIADAMIIDAVFKYLNDFKVSVITTTNTAPDNLYKDGLQREHFLKTINYIKNNFRILSLDSPKDYRIGLIKSENSYFFGANSSKLFKNLLSNLSKNVFFSEIIEVFGRKIEAKNSFLIESEKKQYKAVYFTFDELCEKNLGSADYLEISERFKIIMIENIPQMDISKRNEAIRFVKLIDVLYENKNYLICHADTEPNHLYNDLESFFEFKRTISRLSEMSSKEYINSIIVSKFKE